MATKFETIIHSAATVFAHWGLHRTKIQDIAAHAKVAAGTVYLYADSKDALFDLALRFGMGQDISNLNESGVPYTASRQATYQWLESVANLDDLLPDFHEPKLFELSLDQLFGNLFDFLNQHRFAIRIVERSAHEWNDLATLFFDQIRDPVIHRIGARLARESDQWTPDELEAMSRLVGGAIAFSAVHRFFEGGKPDTTEKSIYKKAVVQSLVRMVRGEN